MKYLILLSVLFTFYSCEEIITIPKPPTYLRLELPEHTYRNYQDNCPYKLSIAEIFSVNKIKNGEESTCHKDIDLGPLNAKLHFSYIPMTEPLSSYVNYLNDKIDDHKIKATAIEDYRIIRSDDKVFCTFFYLQGDVASPFQFYMTDSVNKFASGAVYFNSTPNFDSLRPSLDYLKIDLDHFIENFKWKN